MLSRSIFLHHGPGFSNGTRGSNYAETKVVNGKLLEESLQVKLSSSNNLMRIMKRLKLQELCKLLTSKLWFNRKLKCTLSISRFIHEHLPKLPHQMKPSRVWESFGKVYINAHQILSRSSGKQNLRLPNGSDNDAREPDGSMFMRATWILKHMEAAFRSDDANRKKKSALKVCRRNLISEWIELWREWWVLITLNWISRRRSFAKLLGNIVLKCFSNWMLNVWNYMQVLSSKDAVNIVLKLVSNS